MRGLLATAAGGAVSVTLMACYGIAPCPEGSCTTGEPGPTSSSAGGGGGAGGGQSASSGGHGGQGSGSGHDGGADSGSDGGEQGDGAACVSCKEAWSTPGTDPNSVCGPSQPVYKALTECACTTSCTADCAGSACKGMAPTNQCSICMSAKCLGSLQACMQM